MTIFSHSESDWLTEVPVPIELILFSASNTRLRSQLSGKLSSGDPGIDFFKKNLGSSIGSKTRLRGLIDTQTRYFNDSTCFRKQTLSTFQQNLQCLAYISIQHLRRPNFIWSVGTKLPPARQDFKISQRFNLI